MIREDLSKYDQAVKQLLANEQIIANILQETVSEVKGYSVEDIISCIDGKPTIGADKADNSGFPESIGAEEISLDDEPCEFDIKVRVTNDMGVIIDAYIYIESFDDNEGIEYVPEGRGLFYLAKMVGSRYNEDFIDQENTGVQKVYSIRICTDCPEEYANSITRYSIGPENLIGDAETYPDCYDCISLVLINLGKSEENYTGIIKLLDTVLNVYAKDKEEAEFILEMEYNISLDCVNHSAGSIYDLGQKIWNEAFEKGKVEGKIKGTNTFATLISKLISLFRISDAEKAANDPEYRDKLFDEFGILH